MASKYYYLVSSLPFLRPAQGPGISRDVFLSECRQWLGQKDMKALQSVSLNNFTVVKEDIPVIRAWKEFEARLREELAVLRKARKTGHVEKPGPLVKTVMDADTPLSKEKVLARIRWDYIDSLEAGNYFDISILALYFLKLQILERLMSFDQVKGEKRFQALCEVKYE
jgi:hypothetical protein